jgi:hypothetical protein
MTRPLYETADHRKGEAKTLERIMMHTDAQAIKLSIRDHLDYAMLKNGQIMALIEIKNRRISHQTYATVMIEYKKAEHARHISFETGVPCYLFIQWIDKLGFINFAENFDLGVNGRKDRHAEDYGLVAYYPTERFKIIDDSSV